MENKFKKIYIILTYTGTILSKIIKVYTRAEYCHVSLALDKELNEMYSFGRLKPYNPFISGFVHEGVDRGTFRRFKKTKAEIYSINVTNKQYNIIKKLIKKIEENKKEYKFNILGLFLTAINYKYTKEKSFYCSEFVKYLIEEADINLNLPNITKPMDFKNIVELEFLYKGTLRNYN